MADTEGIQRTLTEYCHLLDDFRLDEWAQLFTEDAKFAPNNTIGEPWEWIEGRQAIRAWIGRQFPDDSQLGKHLTLNTLIDRDGDTATARSDVLLLRATQRGPETVLVGRYLDTLKLDQTRWRFTVREVIVPKQEWLSPDLGVAATAADHQPHIPPFKPQL
jgi:3-phenylpropionate/cinnamic acid dioxygenase small subunit